MKDKGIKEKVVILLTATINPQGMGHTRLKDPRIRKSQYLETLEFYLKETKLKIVFCENTGTNIFEEIKSNEKETKLEYLTFQGNNYDKSRGKGYGEVKTISYAIKHSHFLKECQYIIKITGRIKILNINEYINKLENKSLLGSKEVWVDFYSEWYIISSVVFIISKDFLFSNLKKYENKVHDLKFSFEEMLYESLMNNPDLVIHPSIFKLYGICAGSNKEYMQISYLKHLGTNAYLLSKLHNKRGHRLYAKIEILKYLFYRGVEKISLLFIKKAGYKNE